MPGGFQMNRAYLANGKLKVLVFNKLAGRWARMRMAPRFCMNVFEKTADTLRPRQMGGSEGPARYANVRLTC
jgi:hypothetical protein